MLDAILRHRGAVASSETHLAALHEAARQLQAYAKAERATLGRLLHDGPMQTLALALVRLSSLSDKAVSEPTQQLLQEALGALQTLENELYLPSIDFLSPAEALRQRWRNLSRQPLSLYILGADETALRPFSKDRAFPLFHLADALGQVAAQHPDGLFEGRLRLARRGDAAVLHCTFSGAGTPPNLLSLPPLQTALARLVIVGGRFKISPRRFTALLKP